MITAGAGGGSRAQPDAVAGGGGDRAGHCRGTPATSTSHSSAFSSCGSARVGVSASCTRRGHGLWAPSASEPRRREVQERALLAEAEKGTREAEALERRGRGRRRDPPSALRLRGMCGRRRPSPLLSRG